MSARYRPKSSAFAASWKLYTFVPEQISLPLTIHNAMRHSLTILAAVLQLALPAPAREFTVSGPQGGLAMKLCLPEGFDTARDSCHLVILMHGIFSSKDYPPMPNIARALAKQGIASIRFDFDGHGKSEGQMVDMTIAYELGDARAVWNYAASLTYVTGISLLGHSQGGVIASMTAGSEGIRPESLILLAPGSVIKEATQGGHFFGNSFDPKDPPEYIKCFHHFKLGRNYLLQTQDLDIYGVSGNYQGPVCIIHGNRDGIVPLWCSEKYDAIYEHSEMHIVDGENHLIIRKRHEVIAIISDFLRRELTK